MMFHKVGSDVFLPRFFDFLRIMALHYVIAKTNSVIVIKAVSLHLAAASGEKYLWEKYYIPQSS